MVRCLLLLAVLLVAACAEDEGPAPPLTSLQIRQRLFGHQMEATEKDGSTYLIRFERINVAEIIGKTRDFAHWYTDPQSGLCLQRYQEQLVCAPLYELNVAHYRWGDTVFADLTVRTPGLGHDFDRPFPGH
jgi:hypothetical protein